MFSTLGPHLNSPRCATPPSHFWRVRHAPVKMPPKYPTLFACRESRPVLGPGYEGSKFMASQAPPGPIGANDALMCTVDDGTMSVQDTPEPGPIGGAVDVGKMPLPERFEMVLHRTLPKL